MTVDEAILAKEQGAAVVFCHPWYTRGSSECVFRQSMTSIFRLAEHTFISSCLF